MEGGGRHIYLDGRHMSSLAYAMINCVNFL